MTDARIFPNSVDRAREVLRNNGALFKGSYSIRDIIYASRNPDEGLDKLYLRLREVPKNIWPDKAFVVAMKRTDIREVGKQSIIPLMEQFDTKDEARKFVKENYSDKFVPDYEFERSGEQWRLGDDYVDLEDIQGHASIEFKSETEEGLRNLLDLFGVQEREVIKGPSVVAIKELLGLDVGSLAVADGADFK